MLASRRFRGLTSGMTSPATLYVRDASILFSDVGVDVVALSVAKGDCYAMQDVTADIWRLLEHPITLEALCAELECRYDVDHAQCIDDVSAILGEMTSSGLVIMHSASPDGP